MTKTPSKVAYFSLLDFFCNTAKNGPVCPDSWKPNIAFSMPPILGTNLWNNHVLSNFQNDSNPMDPQVWYTTKQNTTVYAIVIGWPLSDSPLKLGSVKSTNQTQISVLGLNQNVEAFEQTNTGLKVQLPAFSKLYQACYSCQWATVLKMTSVVPVALKTNAPKIEVL